MVAVKLIAADRDYLSYQLPELVQGTNLSHDNVIRCFSAGHTELNAVPLLYLILEYAPQGSLEDRIRSAPLTADAVEDLAFQLASGLAYLHSQRMVHRDVKPANVLLKDNTWKLSDLGTLRVMGTDSMSRTQMQFGSMLYMPPESFDGVVSPAWDLWSLGVVLLRAVTGQVPYSASTQVSLQVAILTHEPAIPDQLPETLNAIIRGCLKKDPRQRLSAKDVVVLIELGRRKKIEAIQHQLNANIREHLGANRLPEAEQALNELREYSPSYGGLAELERQVAALREEQERKARLRRQIADAVLAGDDLGAAVLLKGLQNEIDPSKPHTSMSSQPLIEESKTPIGEEIPANSAAPLLARSNRGRLVPKSLLAVFTIAIHSFLLWQLRSFDSTSVLVPAKTSKIEQKENTKDAPKPETSCSNFRVLFTWRNKASK